MSPEEILQKIKTLQSVGSHQYKAGLFPSQRIHKNCFYKREDNNIFFSTLIAFTLNKLFLQGSQKNLASEIIKGVQQNQPSYQHWKGEGSFNFWQTNPSFHFPFGYFFHRFSRFAIPDDADDSCLVHLTNNFNPAQTGWLINKLEHHYSIDQQVSPLTPSEYTYLRAFPTFFGKKMLREMDACVITNVLYFLLQNQLPWSVSAQDSVQFLTLVLTRKDYLIRPFEVSPNYGNPAVILYHLSRLVGKFDVSELRGLRALLKEAIGGFDISQRCFMDRVLIRTAAARIGVITEPIPLPDNLKTHFDNYYFFQAGLITAFQKSWLNKLSGQSWTHFKYRCEAYYWTLLLENKLVCENDYSKS